MSFQRSFRGDKLSTLLYIPCCGCSAACTSTCLLPLTAFKDDTVTFTAFKLLPDLHKQEECKESQVVGNCKVPLLLCFKKTLFLHGKSTTGKKTTLSQTLE